MNTARSEPLGSTPNASDGGPIIGELVSVDAITPSADARRADAKGRVGNTVTQVGVPAFVVTIATWLCQLMHLDLDPGPGTDMPTIVTAAWVGVLTWGMARWMNRENLKAVDDDGQTLVQVLVAVLIIAILLRLFW